MPSLRGLEPDVCEAISVLRELLTWKGPCSAKVLHSHLCRSYDSSVLNVVGTNPYCLTEFLDDLPELFTVSKNENEEWVIGLTETNSKDLGLYDEEDDGPPPLERIPLDEESEDIVCSAIEFLKQILTLKGPCSSNVLHDHLVQEYGKVATDIMGDNPDDLAEFLMAMPKDFGVKFQKDGTPTIYLAGRVSLLDGSHSENDAKSGENGQVPVKRKQESNGYTGKSRQAPASRNQKSNGSAEKDRRTPMKKDQELNGSTRRNRQALVSRIQKWNGSAEHDDASVDTTHEDRAASLDFIINLLKERGSAILLDKLMILIFSVSKNNVRKCLGTTAPQVIQFLSDYPRRFYISDDNYVFLADSSDSVKSSPNAPSSTTKRGKKSPGSRKTLSPENVNDEFKPEPCQFSETHSKIGDSDTVPAQKGSSKCVNGSVKTGTYSSHTPSKMADGGPIPTKKGSPKCANGNAKPSPFSSPPKLPGNDKYVDRRTAIDFIVQKLKTASHLQRAKDLLVVIEKEAPKLLDVVGPNKNGFHKFLGRCRYAFQVDDKGYVHLKENIQVNADTNNGFKGTSVPSPVLKRSPLPNLHSPLLPIFHRGQVVQLTKAWGIIQRGTMLCDHIIFDATSLRTAGENNELWDELKQGDEVDCLIVHSDMNSNCGFRALKVWKAKPAVRNAQPAGVLETPVICGYAVVTLCEGDAGYMRWTTGPLPGGGIEEHAHMPDLLVFHQNYCGLPPNHRLSIRDSVKFSAVEFPKVWVKYKLWNCLKVWPQSLMRPPTLDRCIRGTYDVSAILDRVTADGGSLKSPELPDPIAFRWETIIFQNLSKFEVRQECLATVLESSDSPYNIHRTIVRLVPGVPGVTKICKQLSELRLTSTASDCSAECAQGSPEHVRGNPLHFDTSVISAGPSRDDTPETMIGRGCVISTNPHGGVLKTAEGTIVSFGPHCAFLKGAPVCHSYFGNNTEVNFEAVVGKVICTATKIWQ